MSLAIGLMSGTSCDGISVALAEFTGRRLRVIAHHTSPYPVRTLQQLREGLQLRTPALSSLNMALGEQFARAALQLLRRAHIAPQRIAVIGSHGHTIYHGPNDAQPSTLQIGEPAVIAERTSIPVVADFRQRDLAAGGEGAPLIPYFDKAFFGNGPARALQNIGGIANVSIVGRGLRTVAFDTGPGNCLIDLMAARISRGWLRYDAGGRLARKGRIDHRAIKQLWHHPYFRRPPPKSTGRELFNEELLRHVFGASLRRAPLNVLATVTYFTAYSIAQGLKRYAPASLREVIVSGGGIYNHTLMRHLTQALAPIPVHPIERYGIPAQAKEPVAFAFLGLRALQKRPNHLPETTGARATCILGSITLGRRL